jgi:AAA+ ATPase superfamily predicted ATPase
VDLALQVGNPQALQCIAAELVVPAQRNSWLARDAVCYLGALPAKARLLAPLRLQFNQELVDPGKLDIQTELRFKDYSTSSTQAQDDRLALPLSKAAAIAVEDYEGALGKPIILQGETLKLSSESVRQALVYVRHNLGRGSVTALILGRRRRGKTSILQTVAQDPDIRRDYVIIADTIEDLPFRSLAEVLGHLGNVLDRVARQLDLECEPLEPLLRTQSHLGWVTIQEWLASVDRKLTKKHRVLLLLDEFQKWLSLLEPESRTRILSILRGLNNRPQDAFLSLSVVLSGLSNIREYARTSADFLNAYRLLEVKAFTADEAAALIRSNPSIEFDTRAVSRIASLSGGNPFLINLLGNEIAGRLREQGRPYCFPDDVERVVRSQLEDRQNSRVWTFLQYLLKQGEEDHASEIVELPGLLALAWTLRARGAQRRTVSVLEIVDEFNTLGVECDTNTLATYLNGATQNELLGRQGDRYSFASEWLAEWLAVTVSDGPLPVTPSKNQDLVLNRYRISELIDTWVMHTKSTPRDDSARLVAGRQ